ncbi:MAG: hypothetical protein ACTHKL_19820 [Streptosporangiaceae bacterium]
MIEAAGALPERAAELPGVISVRRDGDTQIVRVAGTETEAVLRGLLAGDEAVRIIRVNRERDDAEGAS